mgnify:CR=1 FL=1
MNTRVRVLPRSYATSILFVITTRMPCQLDMLCLSNFNRAKQFQSGFDRSPLREIHGSLADNQPLVQKRELL